MFVYDVTLNVLKYHNGTPTFNGTLANFKAMLVHLGLGSKTFAEYMDYIRSDGAWTITEPNAAFTGDVDDYLLQGDFTLQASSPLKGRGSLVAI
jgi:endonuclease/exonuclease/phosphatase family metal-dependent hydrolase